MPLTRTTIMFLADILAPRVCVGCGQEGAWCCAPCAAGIAGDPNVTCIGCDRLSPFGTVCDRCRPELRLRMVCAAAPYADSIVQRLIHLVKYAPARDAAGAFALPIARFATSSAGAALREAIGFDAAIVPVPLHRARERKRGFNQSAFLAECVARCGYGVVTPGALSRRERWLRHRKPQVGLPRTQRLMNVTDAFRCRQPNRIHSRNVLLVDDVVTTGATMVACARELRDAGARAVFGFALARG